MALEPRPAPELSDNGTHGRPASSAAQSCRLQAATSFDEVHLVRRLTRAVALVSEEDMESKEVRSIDGYSIGVVVPPFVIYCYILQLESHISSQALLATLTCL